MKAFALAAAACLMVGQAEAATGTIRFDGTTGLVDYYGYTLDANGDREDYAFTSSLLSGLSFSMIFHYDTKDTVYFPAGSPYSYREGYYTPFEGFELYISGSLIYSTFTSPLEFTAQSGALVDDRVYDEEAQPEPNLSYLWASHTDDYIRPRGESSIEYYGYAEDLYSKSLWPFSLESNASMTLPNYPNWAATYFFIYEWDLDSYESMTLINFQSETVTISVDNSPAPVPLPAAAPMLLTGAVALFGIRAKRSRRQASE